MKSMQLELCAASVKAILLAKKYNFDRIELCQNLEQGGTTPSAGLIQFAKEIGIETHVLIRPRSGNFIYNSDEIELMLADVKNCNSNAVKGVVVGVLNEKKELDIETLKSMILAGKNLEFTFHRAVDDVIDWKKAMDLLIQMNFKRILTSGGKKSIDEGFINAEEMVHYSNGRIEIMIGGGVNSENIFKIKNEIQPAAIHFSATQLLQEHSNSLFSTDCLEIDENRLQSIVDNL